MSIKVGAVDAHVYIGNTAATKVYLGSTQAWPTTPPTGTRLFTGDYTTWPQSTWDVVQCKGYNGSARSFTDRYSMSIVNDATYGKIARVEVRQGDNPGFSPGTDRSEVQGGNSTGGVSGQTLWYGFRTRFDANFPQNHASLGWGAVNQWHPNSSGGSPPVGWYVDQRNGYFSLTITKQASVGQYLNQYSIFDVPLGTNWHDIKMRILWSASDTVGSVQLWYNGVRATFLDGTQEHKARTLIPGTNGTYYKEGYYRQTMAPTGIVYHTGFRCATTEAAL